MVTTGLLTITGLVAVSVRHPMSAKFTLYKHRPICFDFFVSKLSLNSWAKPRAAAEIFEGITCINRPFKTEIHSFWICPRFTSVAYGYLCLLVAPPRRRTCNRQLVFNKFYIQIQVSLWTFLWVQTYTVHSVIRVRFPSACLNILLVNSKRIVLSNESVCKSRPGWPRVMSEIHSNGPVPISVFRIIVCNNPDTNYCIKKGLVGRRARWALGSDLTGSWTLIGSRCVPFQDPPW